METLGNTKVVKSRQQKYICVQCDYTTSRYYDYEKHLSTDKHKLRVFVGHTPHFCACGKSFTRSDSLYRHKKTCNYEDFSLPKREKVAECFQMFPNSEDVHKCECGKSYKSRSGLWKHLKSCKQIGIKEDKKPTSKSVAPVSSNPEVPVSATESSDIMEALGSLNVKLDQTCQDNSILKEDNKLLKREIKQLKSGVLEAVSEPKVVNNYNNIIVLLNQKCGNAIAIDDFAKQIAMSLDDVSYALENGKVKGIENIIRKRFEELGTYSRPLHCTDVKRGTTYVKGDEGWEKDNGRINKMIKDVEFVQTKGIKMWGDANPSFSKGNATLMDKWLKIVQCLTSSIEGVGIRKIEKRCHEMSKIDQEEWKT